MDWSDIIVKPFIAGLGAGFGFLLRYFIQDYRTKLRECRAHDSELKDVKRHVKASREVLELILRESKELRSIHLSQFKLHDSTVQFRNELYAAVPDWKVREIHHHKLRLRNFNLDVDESIKAYNEMDYDSFLTHLEKFLLPRLLRLEAAFLEPTLPGDFTYTFPNHKRCKEPKIFSYKKPFQGLSNYAPNRLYSRAEENL